MKLSTLILTILFGAILIFAALFMTNCTDATVGKFFSMGGSAHVECYSGGLKIYDGYSTGKVKSEENSDGYFFKEKDTGKFKEVSGNCIITY